MLLTLAQIKRKSFESRRNSLSFFSFFTRGGCVSCLRACLGARLLPQSYQYSNLSEGADRVAGQLRGDKECRRPFSGVTKSGRIWRRVPESGARSVHRALCFVAGFRWETANNTTNNLPTNNRNIYYLQSQKPTYICT